MDDEWGTPSTTVTCTAVNGVLDARGSFGMARGYGVGRRNRLFQRDAGQGNYCGHERHARDRHDATTGSANTAFVVGVWAGVLMRRRLCLGLCRVVMLGCGVRRCRHIALTGEACITATEQHGYRSETLEGHRPNEATQQQ